MNTISIHVLSSHKHFQLYLKVSPRSMAKLPQKYVVITAVILKMESYFASCSLTGLKTVQVF